MPEDGIKMIMNEDGVFEKYNDEYDLTIHFESQEEQDVFIKNAQKWRLAWKNILRLFLLVEMAAG